ncbi:hypothetical protein PBRA_003721 [Plasmodiophora brassicae]|uniref:Uncharacterized protein n=1 Tax=Plasmodiophora brassicae TaxID=37360 RepID=A0A0G4II75_PLABS|nr:hypothetical protein PBRA_003721 [Plasmodiophora brassicae]
MSLNAKSTMRNTVTPAWFCMSDIALLACLNVPCGLTATQYPTCPDGSSPPRIGCRPLVPGWRSPRFGTSGTRTWRPPAPGTCHPLRPGSIRTRRRPYRKIIIVVQCVAYSGYRNESVMAVNRMTYSTIMVDTGRVQARIVRRIPDPYIRAGARPCCKSSCGTGMAEYGRWTEVRRPDCYQMMTQAHAGRGLRLSLWLVEYGHRGAMAKADGDDLEHSRGIRERWRCTHWCCFCAVDRGTFA